jgi:hypothetical protein
MQNQPYLGRFSGFLTIGFNAFGPDNFIYGHPVFVQAVVKIGMAAWKLVTLITKINPHLLVAWPHSAVFEKLALLISAALAVFRCEIVQHFFKGGIFLENRITQQSFKPLGVDMEITQLFLKLHAEPPDITPGMGKTGFTAQAARGDGFLDGFTAHLAPPYRFVGDLLHCSPCKLGVKVA